MKTYPVTIYTIGHSNRTLTGLLGLLESNNISTLVDIRSYPYSKRYPHFSQHSIREAVMEYEIQYHWLGRQLGGMRQPTRALAHAALPTAGLRGFAEYMESDLFAKAVVHLINLADKGNTSILCAEKMPGQCHHSLISDYLVLNRVNVIHLIDASKRVTHQLNQDARMESKLLVYDRNVTANLKFH